LESKSNLNRNGLSGRGGLSYMKRGSGVLKLYSLGLNASYSSRLSESDRFNVMKYLGVENPFSDQQFRNKKSHGQDYSASMGAMIKIGKGLYLEPELRGIAVLDQLKRSQGIKENIEKEIDSLSPDFNRTSLKLNPGFRLRWNQSKTRWVSGLAIMMSDSRNFLNQDNGQKNNYTRLLPSFSWEFDYKTGHRLSLDYSSFVDEPALELMVPVVENANPQFLIYGNRALKPETRHDIYANWLLFDQFSQTSIFARVGSTYTLDKIGYSRNISDSLVQVIGLLNTKNESSFNGNMDFSTPLKFVGLNLHFDVDFRWSKGYTFVNKEENATSSVSRSFRLSFDNRKQEKWSLDFGGEVTVTDAKYSLQQSLDNRYLTWNYYAELNFDPSDSWHFGAKMDVLNYSAGNFTSDVNIPLISAEMSYSFLKNHRAVISLESCDLLDKNKGLERIAEMNYLREVKSNIIGRYVMLSFKYRLNKAAKTGSGFEIRMKKR
jgi:hypothetical protein